MKKLIVPCLLISCIIIPAEKRVTIVEPVLVQKLVRSITPPYNSEEVALKKLQEKAALDAQWRSQSGSGLYGR